MQEEQPKLSESETFEKMEQLIKNRQRYSDEHILEKITVVSTSYLREEDEILLSLIRYVKIEKQKFNRFVHNNAVLLIALAIVTLFSGTVIGFLIGIILHFSHSPLNCPTKPAADRKAVLHSLSDHPFTARQMPKNR